MKRKLTPAKELSLAVGFFASTFFSIRLFAAASLHKFEANYPTEIPFKFSGELEGKEFEPWQLTPSIFSPYTPGKQPPGWVDPVPEDFSGAGLAGDIYEIITEPNKTTLAQTFAPLTPIKYPKLPWFDLSQVPKAPAKPEVVEQPKILTPAITSAFDIDGRVAVFKTTDEHLYYVLPNRWKISMNGVTVETPKDPANSTRLRFLLSPSYSWTRELTKKIKKSDPLAFFVPLPKKFTAFKLEIPNVLGNVQNQLLPTDTMSIGEQIYMNVELGKEQLEILKILKDANTFLTGSVSYEYPYDSKNNFQLISEIWLDFEKI
ncbi:MAG: hypothetical protein EOP04_19325 [Proteobacteria bacterium]|nr:MAG: hypothetical protein EOP04_19325 [Pseudomonadota bacterium]